MSNNPSLELVNTKSLDPRRLKEMFERLTGRKVTDEEYQQMIADLKKSEEAVSSK